MGDDVIEFSEEQQQIVQGLIDDAYKRAYAKTQKTTTGSSEGVEHLRMELKSLMIEKKNAMLLRAISKHNVVDVDEIASLISGNIFMDEFGSLFVGDDMVGDGDIQPLIRGDGTPVTVDEYISKWLNTRPHHLRSKE